jgi:parvulin-like peptidyl-prolyl isomerase
MPPDKGRATPVHRHVARAERERRQARWILGTVAAVVLVAFGLLAYGWVDQTYLQPARPAVRVNGAPISYRELGARIRMSQAQLLSQREQMQQTLNLLAGNPDTEAYIQQQISQVNALLQDTAGLTSRTLSQLIDARLIQQEAGRRGIVVTTDDVDQAIRDAFGFYPNGTPTLAPTATRDATLEAQATQTLTPSPTETPTLGPSPTSPPSATPRPSATPGPTATASPSPTPYTQALFDADYQKYLGDLKTNLDVPEDILRARYAEDVYRERLRKTFEASTPRDQDQVWAKHILVNAEGAAFALLSRYRQGESWDALAAQYSTDTGNKDRGGDLGWFGRGAMVAPFEEAAFAAKPGEVVGPIATSFGWHLIMVLGHETRRLDESAYQQAVDQALSDWLTAARASATLEYDRSLYTPTPLPSTTPLPPTASLTPTP